MKHVDILRKWCKKIEIEIFDNTFFFKFDVIYIDATRVCYLCQYVCIFELVFDAKNPINDGIFVRYCIPATTITL